VATTKGAVSPDHTGIEEFRGLLLRYRGRTRLSQTQLAVRTGVHLRSVQAWESGVSIPATPSARAAKRA
jgi:DNA-binding transcriptional regulator YiaG